MDNVFKAMGVRLMQRVDAKVTELVPRQAFVTRSSGRDVFVRFAGESASAPESQFTSTVMGLPAGSMGWVFRLGGSKGLFVATGVSIPVPFSGYRQTSVNTTSVSTFTFGASQGGSISLPAGTYRANGVASATGFRTTASSNLVAVMRIGGVEGETMQINSSLIGGTAYRPFPVSWVIDDIEFTTDGSGVAVEFGVRGHTDAGTTYLVYAACHGTFKKIG